MTDNKEGMLFQWNVFKNKETVKGNIMQIVRGCKKNTCAQWWFQNRELHFLEIMSCDNSTLPKMHYCLLVQVYFWTQDTKKGAEIKLVSPTNLQLHFYGVFSDAFLANRVKLWTNNE